MNEQNDGFKIRLGTRGSQLALWQSRWVQYELIQLGFDVELVLIKTEGDQRSGPLSQIGGQGVFTKQLQLALLDHQIDLAVHSLKDLPTADHPELEIAAIPAREDRADAFVSRDFASLDAVPSGGILGTGSVRRAAQILRLRPDLIINDIRGNVDSRLQKLDRGEYAAIILAAAGLNRLGFQDSIRQKFSTAEILPAVGQGALGLEIRSADSKTRNAVSHLNDAPSYFAAMAERSMLRRLFAGCLSPVGVDSLQQGDHLSMTGIVLSRDGRYCVKAKSSGKLTDGIAIGRHLADNLIAQGADKLLRPD